MALTKNKVWRCNPQIAWSSPVAEIANRRALWVLIGRARNQGRAQNHPRSVCAGGNSSVLGDTDHVEKGGNQSIDARKLDGATFGLSRCDPVEQGTRS